MLDGMSIVQAVDCCFDEAQARIDEMADLAEKKAKIQKDYRVAVARYTASYRSAGYQATLVEKLVKGHEKVADLEYRLVLADAEYDANHEAVLLWKKRGDYYRELAAREWSQTGASYE